MFYLSKQLLVKLELIIDLKNINLKNHIVLDTPIKNKQIISGNFGKI